MGSGSDGSEGGGIGSDCGVGKIISVPRRNVSWWPGRVVGPEELLESHLMPPWSGSPRKLLGREEASVDWYNLEKSKRVKSFRCVEFDASIEMAQAANCNPIKKRVKYAHQEDAMLHTLELEKKQLDTKLQSTAISFHANKKALGLSDGGSNQYSAEVYVPCRAHNQKFQKSLRKTPSLIEKYYLDHSLSVIRNRKVRPCVRKIGKHEISTHLRLEDVSPQIGMAHYDHFDLLPLSGDGLKFLSRPECGNSFSVLKRKAVQSVKINDSPAKRLDRCELLATVSQTSGKFSASCSFQSLQDSTVNQMLGVEYQIGISHNALKNTSMHPLLDPDDPLYYSRRSYEHAPAEAENSDPQGKPGCISTESTQSGWTEDNDFDSSATDSELDMCAEKCRSDFDHTYKQTAGSSVESGMPECHLNRKHDGQIFTKKLQDFVDGNFSGADWPNFSLWETSFDCKGTKHNVGKVKAAILNAHGKEFLFERKLDDDKEDELFTELGNRGDDLERETSDLVDSDDDSKLISQLSWGPVRSLCMFRRSCREEPEDDVDQLYNSHFSSIMMPILVDVDLKVQARYRGPHVPLISQTSRLDGKAIIGHAIQVEILRDGSTDLLVLTNVATSDGNRASPPIWKTAKRTCMHRLGRLKPDPSNYISKRTPYFDPRKMHLKKRIYHTYQSPSGKIQRKPLKTRTVSSFTYDTKINLKSGIFGLGLDNTMPLVSCVPVKVVFSRILESVGRLSLAVAHRAVAASAAEGNPL